ncbi:CGNR zinc finger domain-containing protein [Flindersiella endophytica]
MHWTEFDGYPMPNRIGGHVALDFCNTWAGWNAEPGDPRRDWIPSYEHFAVWAKFAGLIDAETTERLLRKAKREPADAEATVRQAWYLRRALHDVLLEPANRSAFQIVAQAAQQANATVRLVAEADGLAQWRFPSRSGLDQPLLAVARAAADLLGSPARQQVKACPGHSCGWLFLDPRGRRRWCIMATCGNRSKVRAHAARQQDQPEPGEP